MTDGKDFYEMLELELDASSEEIQEAYYKMVRKHPPEKDETGFQQVQRAYEVLSNNESRREYDETRTADPETRELIEQGRDLLEKGDHGAIEPLKRALVRQNDSSLIRDLFVQALMLREEYSEAENQAHKVLSNEPHNAVYNMRMGDILTSLDRHEEALGYFKRAVSYDQESPMPIVKLAYCLNITGDMLDAVVQLYKGINRDGKIDFNDFIYFRTLCRIYTLNQELDKLSEVHAEIKKILPPDEETRAFVAWSYYIDAVQLSQLGAFDAAVKFIDEASEIDNALPELADVRAEIHEFRHVANELKLLNKDEDIIPVLRHAVGLLAHSNLFGGDDESKEIFKQILDVMQMEVSMVGSKLPHSIGMLRNKYPAIAKFLNKFIANIDHAAKYGHKKYIKLICPKCGTEAYANRPTIESLPLGMETWEMRMSRRARRYNYDEYGNYRNIYLSQEQEEYVLSNLIFTCDKCNCSYDGHSKKINNYHSSSSYSSYNEPSKSSSCFIVTAACGNENAYPVTVLRRFRNDHLHSTWWGAILSKIYDVLGPIAAFPVKHIHVIRGITYRFVYSLATFIDNRAMK